LNNFENGIFFINSGLTIYYNDDILSSMQSYKYPTVIEKDNLTFIYSGLGSISGKWREHLKNIAQSLIAIQDRPGTPIPDSICREIMRNPTNELM
jgi:hypothetical protein